MNIDGASNGELLRTYAAILDELNRREVVRSRNAPAGDLAELVVAEAYSGVLARPSEKSYDVVLSDGRTLQVKTRLVNGTARRGNYSPFRSWTFDSCVFVLLDSASYEVVQAVEVPSASLSSTASRSQWIGAHRVFLRTPLTELDGAIDVTEKVAAAARAVLARTGLAADGEPAGD